MWGEEEGGELVKLWVVMFKHLSWSCLPGICIPLMSFTPAPETPLEGSRASKSNACPRAGKGQGKSLPAAVPGVSSQDGAYTWIRVPGPLAGLYNQSHTIFSGHWRSP